MRLAAHMDLGLFPFVSIVKGMTFVLVELPDTATLSALEPSAQTDPDALLKLDEGWAPSLTASYYYTVVERSEGGTPTRVRSRMFSPRIEEDADIWCAGEKASNLRWSQRRLSSLSHCS